MDRDVVGSTRYPTPPPAGTIVGPTRAGGFLVVLDTADGVTTFGNATAAELRATVGREPWSVTEATMLDWVEEFYGSR